MRTGGRHEAPSVPHLVPGANIADGRYRLLVFHGGPAGLQFWQALDTALDRQVALTFIDPAGRLSDQQLEAILAETLKLGQIERPGLARVLDVNRIDTGGLVVAEWIRGGSLKEVADTSPSALGGARAVQSLAAAADEAHRAGVALSVDHPSRIRVSIGGDVALAFPATLPDASPESDVHGIGAILYALLVDRWPLVESGAPSGMRPAAASATGDLVEPREINPAIPFPISTAAVRAIQPGGGISTAPTLLSLLQQATAAADRTDLVDPVPTPVAAPARAAQASPAVPADEQARRRKTMLIGIGAGAAVLIIALIALASVLGRMFGDVGGGIKGDQLGLNTTTAKSSSPSGSVVKPTGAVVFSPAGGADNPNLAGLAIDGDPTSSWPTDIYTDPVPFPNFKNGVGLMLQLPQPTVVGSVTLSVPSTGTKVQIRSATSSNPASLDDTTALTQPTALNTGSNTIEVPSAPPTSYLLVWITTMGQTDGKNKTALSEITVRAAG